MTMSEFEVDLRNAFAAEEEPVDAGFSKAFARRLARRESNRWHVLALALAIILAAGFSGLGMIWAPIGAALADYQSPFVGFDLAAALDVAAWGLAQIFVAASKISPFVLVVAATSAGAVAYAAQSD